MYISYILKKNHIQSLQFYNKNYILDKVYLVFIYVQESRIYFYLHPLLKIMVQDNTLVKRIFPY